MYAAVTNNSKTSMAYKTKVYFWLTGYVRLVVTLLCFLEPGLRLKAQPLSGSLLLA